MSKRRNLARAPGSARTDCAASAHRTARAAAVLAGVAATGALVAVSGAPASAATGVLALDGTEHTDPRGCYPLPAGPHRVANHTDEPVFLLSGRDCTGPVVGVLLPGEAASEALGARGAFAP